METRAKLDPPPRGNDGLLRKNLTAAELRQLNGQGWLSGDTIQKFCDLLHSQAPSSAGSSWSFRDPLAYPVVDHDGTYHRRMKGIDVSTLKYIFFPVNLAGNHWVLYVVDLKGKTTICYDSLAKHSRADPRETEAAKTIAGMMRAVYEGDESVDIAQWFKPSRGDVPEQTDGFNCGIYLCGFILSFVAHGQPPSTQRQPFWGDGNWGHQFRRQILHWLGHASQSNSSGV